MLIQDIFETELFYKHSMAALFYLIESGREMDFDYNRERYFISRDGLTKHCSLWKGKTEQAFESMEALSMNALIGDRKFYEIWSEVDIQVLY